MNKKYNILIAAILLVIIIIIAIKFKPKKSSLPINEKVDKVQTLFDWKSLSSSNVMKIAGKKSGVDFYPEVAIELSAVADLTGDGIPEGVFTGDGGNNELSIVLSRDSTTGSITLLRQKDVNGIISPVTLYSIGRAMVNEGYELLPKDHGYYTISKSYNKIGDTFICNESGVNAYIWNPSTKLFEWSSSYSEKFKTEACK